MEVDLGPLMFEWLLADWAGHADRPEAVFPRLKGIDRASLADDLENSLKVKLTAPQADAS